MAIQTGLEGKPLVFSLIIGLIGGAAIAGVGYQLKIKPLKQEIQRQEARLKELAVKIQDGLAAEQELPKFRETVAALQAELDKLLLILPTQRKTEELLRRIRTLVDQGNFGFQRFEPKNATDRDFYREWPISITVSGGYHNLAKFFDSISNFRRIINIEDLLITARTAPGQQTIGASFIAKTYIYREPPAEPPKTDEPRKRRGQKTP